MSARRRAATHESPESGRTTTERVMLPGIEASNWGKIARTRSTVSMIFAPGCRKIMMSTAGVPFATPMVRRSSTECSTVATSDKLHGSPVPIATIKGR